MNNIKKIMKMINWKNDLITQIKGVCLAERIKNLKIFMQPMGYGSKAVWENCALIICKRSDKELQLTKNKII